MFKLFFSFKSDPTNFIPVEFRSYYDFRAVLDYMLTHYNDFIDIQVLFEGDEDGDNSSQ